MKLRLSICILALLLAAMAASSPPAHAQQQSFTVLYEVKLDSHFGFYSQTTQEDTLVISGTAGPTNGSVVVTVDFSFTFEGVDGLPPGANYTIATVSQHPVVSELTVVLPPGANSFEFAVSGRSYDTSILLRGAVTITYATVAMNAPPYNPVSYQVLIPTSPRFQIVSVFPGTAPGLTTQYVNINGTSYLATGFSYLACFTQLCSVFVGANTISIIYQPAYFNYFVAAYLILAIGLLAVIGIILRERTGNASKITALGRKAFDTLVGLIRSIDSKKLLAAFVIVSVLMISLAFVFGPSPSPRAYVAATPQTTQALAPFITAAGYTYLTPSEAGDEFDAMSSLNTYYVVIVADYPPPLDSAGFLSNSRIIVMSDYANATLQKGLQTYFGPEVTVAATPEQLQTDLTVQAQNYSPNHLGFPVSSGIYAAVVTVEGALSLAIPFLALAFFARYMVESTAKGTVKLAEAAAFSFLIFIFGELVYIQTAVLLSLPVALHATISSQETAIGALGFGGGSRPREVLGALGFLFGAVVGSTRGIRVDRVVLIGFISAFLFLLADPLQLGQDFYNLLIQVLSSEGGTAFGQAAFTEFRSFIAIFMNAFGNYSVPTFFSQHGAVLFFAGAVPFALYTYVRRSTATLLLIYCAIIGGLGYVRIGDQDPLKAIASTTPGLAMAVLFIIVFLGFDRMERFLRQRLALG